MKTTITYEEADLLNFIKQMLAVEGLKPRQEIKISTTVVPSTDSAYPDSYEHSIVVDCERSSFPNTCPICKVRLVDGVAAPPLPSTKTTVYAPPAPPAPSEQLYTNEIDEDESQRQEDVSTKSLALDDSLGESLEPPVLEKPFDSKVGDGGIHSIVGASERLRVQREKELPKSQQRMRGESGRPPKGGR